MKLNNVKCDSINPSQSGWAREKYLKLKMKNFAESFSFLTTVSGQLTLGARNEVCEELRRLKAAEKRTVQCWHIHSQPANFLWSAENNFLRHVIKYNLHQKYHLCFIFISYNCPVKKSRFWCSLTYIWTRQDFFL